MAAVNPPFALQNAGATHTAANDRTSLGSLLAGVRTAGSLVSRGGVQPLEGGSLKVQAQGSPAMAVDVLNGVAFVPGSENASQGVYACTNDATVSLSIAAAHATLPRIDIVVAQVQDSQYSGVANTWSLAVVTGTPAGSPVAPAAPNNSITLAQIAVAAAVTSIVNANITDLRFYASALGGVIYCTSTTRPGTTLVPKGQLIFETDTGKLFKLHTDSTWWGLQPQYVEKAADETVTSSTTIQDDDHLFLTPDSISARYIFECDILYRGLAGVGMKYAWTVPTGALLRFGQIARENGATTTLTRRQVETDGPNVGTEGTATPNYLSIRGILIMSTTSGPIKFRWAQAASNATGTVVEQYSTMRMTRVV